MTYWIASMHFIQTTRWFYKVDHSSGHTKKKENGLSVDNMNLEWGGKQCKLRATLLTANCLGDIMEYKNTTKDNRENIYKRMSPGEIQDMIFKESDLPPFFSPDQPEFNTNVVLYCTYMHPYIYTVSRTTVLCNYYIGCSSCV